MNLLKPKHNIGNLIAGLGFILFHSCAPLSVTTPPPVFDQVLGREKISVIVTSLEEQTERVQTLFGSGSVTVTDEGSETEANILIAGLKDPLRIKIEITHPWGRPLFDTLIQNSKIIIISYPEKRVYRGPMDGVALSRFFPVSLTPDLVWSLFRGYPTLRKYDRAISLEVHTVTFLDREGAVVQRLELYKGDVLPRSLLFPGQGVEAVYSDYEEQDGIFYAETIKLDDPDHDATLELNLKQMVFNEPIPEAVFEQKILPGFQEVPLKGVKKQ